MVYTLIEEIIHDLISNQRRDIKHPYDSYNHVTAIPGKINYLLEKCQKMFPGSKLIGLILEVRHNIEEKMRPNRRNTRKEYLGGGESKCISLLERAAKLCLSEEYVLQAKIIPTLELIIENLRETRDDPNKFESVQIEVARLRKEMIKLDKDSEATKRIQEAHRTISSNLDLGQWRGEKANEVATTLTQTLTILRSLKQELAT